MPADRIAPANRRPLSHPPETGRASSKIYVLARREFVTRIRSKGFWIATLVLPLFIAAVTFLPALIIERSRAEQKAVVVDATGKIADGLIGRLSEAGGAPADQRAARIALTAEPPAADPQAQRADLDERVLAGEIDAWIWVTPEGLAEDRVEYHAESVSNILTQQVLRGAVADEVRALRLLEAGYDPARVEELSRGIDLDTIRVAEGGSRQEAGEAGFVLAYVMFFLLYMILLIWGQQVLTGVLEEKTSRIVEVIVSTARPFDLMMGKILGIGGVGLTQLAIWLVALVALTAPGLVTMIASLPEDVRIPTVSPAVALYFLGYFVLGFFVFATIYAAIGAAFNNAQEAQQLASLPAILVISPVMVVFPVINDPDGVLAVVTSLFPPFTPLLMPVRIAVKMPPLWQIGLSFVLTAGFAAGMVWLCARIYRVGILMYGKKPTLAEMARWVRHS